MSEQDDREIAELTEKIRLNPNDTVAYLNKGNVYSDKSERNQMLVYIDISRAMRLNPNYAFTYYSQST